MNFITEHQVKRFYIETCPECGGKLRVIACIEDPQLVANILGHVRSRAATAEAVAWAPPGHPAEALKLV